MKLALGTRYNINQHRTNNFFCEIQENVITFQPDPAKSIDFRGYKEVYDAMLKTQFNVFNLIKLNTQLNLALNQLNKAKSSS